MDTWATSSLSPQIATGWPIADGTAHKSDPELFDKIFPMDMRPQGHDIIRTWLFATVVRAHHENDTVPWKNTAISGWILDPDRKKMSKSKGNAQTPEDVVREFGADAVRYWAASGRLGTDAAYDTGQMKVGRRLAMKVLNASKFALMTPPVTPDADAAPTIEALLPHVTQPLDVSLLTALRDVVENATKSFETWDYTRSLELTETFFWAFCDDYIELVKERANNRDGAFDEAESASARAAGVTIKQGTTVKGLLTDGDRVTGVELADRSTISADTVVVATGVWTKPFLDEYGIDVPIRVHREQIVMIHPGLELGAVPVFSDLVSLQYVRPDVRGEILFGNSDLAELEIADPDGYRIDVVHNPAFSIGEDGSLTV